MPMAAAMRRHTHATNCVSLSRDHVTLAVCFACGDIRVSSGMPRPAWQSHSRTVTSHAVVHWSLSLKLKITTESRMRPRGDVRLRAYILC